MWGIRICPVEYVLLFGVIDSTFCSALLAYLYYNHGMVVKDPGIKLKLVNESDTAKINHKSNKMCLCFV